MLEKIRFEWFIIKEFTKVVLWHVKRSRSLRPAVSLLNVRATYKLDENGPWKKGNYYTYMRDFYSC